MTDKERLEEIKNSYLVGIHRLFGTPWVSIPKENIDWLINRVEELEKEKDELAERVHKLALDWSEFNKELEIKLSINTNNMKQLQKENERYKQALELIYKDTFYESEHDLVSPIHVIRKRAEKALEGKK